VLTRQRIEAAAGEPLREPDMHSPRASGTLEAHYAPRARVRLMPGPMLHAALQVLGPSPLKLAVYSRTVGLPAGSALQRRVMPAQADRAAHELFSILRELDATGVDLIWVEAPPSEPEWDGVRDRLERASAA
jgi:L-threonylcarbamoyladenylate synthase